MTRTVLALLAGLLVLSGCSGLDGTGEKGYVTGEGQVVQRAVSEREQPVELVGEDLEGRTIDLQDFRGKPVVVVVWGAWCPPCREEVPDVVAAAEELGDAAAFVGINRRDPSPETAQAFVRTNGIPYPSYFSPDGKEMLAFRGVLAPNSIPSFVVLDAEGRVAASILGKLPSSTTLVQVVEDVLGETADG
ncbi:TlpA disulfide reductase family protein [Nocardioides sp.]|uniref:TlpA family protein disulfide reductase n=1 Tax=Nocardioides sp. TaxID=35761 RepID=UPI002ED4C3AE